MRFSRTSIAAAVTIAALGLLAAVALASGGSQTTIAPAPTAETDPPAQVRTETVQRTVHRTDRARSASSSDDGTLDQGPGDAPRAPVAPAQAAGDTNRGPGSTSRGGSDDGPNHDVGDDHGGHGGDDGPGHDSGDDHGGHSGHGG